ncbi:MAG: TonB-dependent receptor, partial [Candidatus Neomarinimicrobiota bacterium]|nr:TonB-dependent receptor [Candidatus Neomarinimicrobiota bacterium]
MNRSIRILAGLLIFSLTTFLSAQMTVSGTVTDASTGDALAGANVVVDGTELGTAADTNGAFTINDVPDGSTLTASMIGYEDASATASTTVNFALTVTTLQLSAVTVAGNFAIERETPVAFTTIGEEHIKNNFTVQDVPHLFANTPGIYVTTDGGSGMGDSKVKIRGFDEQRIAVMINNVPVNDPESKKVYWSNWGSLPAAAQSIQVQRGVGSSMYGSGALGGSINVITKDAPAEESTELALTYGQYGIKKYGINYNSGLINKNRAYILRLNYITGNGWRQDTFYEGLQYYLSSMFYMGRNTFKVIFHGAPQYHAYSYYGFGGSDYASYGYDWNGHPHVDENDLPAEEGARATNLSDVIFMRTPIGAARGGQIGGWVVGNGRASLDNNVFHKPQFEVHHNLSLNDNMKLTNTVFASKGYGYGENLDSYYMVSRNDDGNMTFAGIDTAGQYQFRAYSDHFQTGALSNFDMNIMGSTISIGAEFRYWTSRHAQELINIFDDSDGLISFYIGSTGQKFGEGDLMYDYT